jgi:type I restriction enzyme M protein
MPNYAWVQHFISHLSPTGLAGFVLANGSMSSNQSGEGEIRKAIIEADLVDCMGTREACSEHRTMRKLLFRK